MHGKYRYICLTIAKHRSNQDWVPVQEVMSWNQEIALMEFITEHYQKIFDQQEVRDAQILLLERFERVNEIKALNLVKYF